MSHSLLEQLVMHACVAAGDQRTLSHVKYLLPDYLTSPNPTLAVTVSAEDRVILHPLRPD